MEDAIAPPNETCNPKGIVSSTVTPHPLGPPPARQDVGHLC